MKFRKVRTCLATTLGAAMLVASTGAQALLIDFTAQTWQDDLVGGPASETRTIGGIEVTVSAYSDLAGFVPGLLTFTNFDGNGADAPCGTLLACDTDGGGIGDDEITFGLSDGGNEAIVVSFGGQAVDITRIHVLDLFAAPDGTGGGNEVAEFLADALPIPFYGKLTGTATDGTGYAATGDLGFDGVTMIAFFSTDLFGSGALENSDFALAAIEVNIPEPESLALLALGLFGLAGLARRRPTASRI